MEDKRKRKNYFANQGKEQNKRRRLSLECGMKGFLCTCNFREKDCVREAYNLLNEYADKIYGPEEKQPKNVNDAEAIEKDKIQEDDIENDGKNVEESNKKDETKQDEKDEVVQENNETKQDENDEVVQEKNEIKQDQNEVDQEKNEIKQDQNDEVVQEKNETKPDQNDEMVQEKNEKKSETEIKINEAKEEEEDEDISTALSREIDELKAEAGKPPMKRRFQVVDTGVNNVVFIKSTVPDTLEVVTEIIKDICETKKQKSRYLLRMIPIQISCKAYMDDIKPKANVLFDKYFVQEPKTYSIVVNRHHNSNLNRNELIEGLAKLIASKNPGNKANLKSPEIAVVVEIVRAVCLISIAPNYFLYKKYNLLEMCNNKEK